LGNDHEEITQLVQGSRQEMIRAIWRVVRNPEDAEDALQEALGKIWRKRARFSDHPNPKALLLRVSLDAACDQLRKRIRESNRHRDWPHMETIRGCFASASEKLLAKEQMAEVLQSIAKLPRNQTIAVLMHDVEDKSYAEISQALNCSETTVRSRVSRARGRLAKNLVHLRFTDTGGEMV